MTFRISFEALDRDQGQRDLVVRQLTRKVGMLPEDGSARITRLDTDTVLALAEALLDFATLLDRTAWPSPAALVLPSSASSPVPFQRSPSPPIPVPASAAQSDPP